MRGLRGSTSLLSRYLGASCSFGGGVRQPDRKAGFLAPPCLGGAVDGEVLDRVVVAVNPGALASLAARGGFADAGQDGGDDLVAEGQ